MHEKIAPSVLRLSLWSLVLAAVFAGALSAQTQNLDTIYEKAKSEGALVLYVGGPTAPWEAVAKDFSARYPGVAVSVTGGFSNVLDKKIDAQLANGKLEIDLAAFQTLQDFVRWKQQNALLEFKPEGVTADPRSYEQKVKGRDDLTVAAEFVRHVRNTEATDPELELLEAAFTAALDGEER